MEGLRLRLLFKDPDILSDFQISEGLDRSWLFIIPQQHRTISDLSSYLLRLFQLQGSCPHGILLSMDGFVLPPFELTRILKDKDIVSVKKKGGILAVEGNNGPKEILDVERNNGPNVVENLQLVQKQPEMGGTLLLANEEFGLSSGGYDSEEPEDESEKEEEAESKEDTSHPENAVGGSAVSKKRKSLETLPSSKKKKRRTDVEEKCDEQSKKQEDLTSKRSHHKQRNVFEQNNKDMENDKESGERSEDNVSTPSMQKNDEVQKNGIENEEATPKPDGTKKKGPSRSARRKKAKRKWLQEMTKIQKKNAVGESEGLRNWKELQAKAGKGKHNFKPKGRVSDEADGQSQGRRNWKQQRTEDKKEKETGEPKGLLHWKRLHAEDKDANKNKQEHVKEKSNLCGVTCQNSDIEDEVVPVEIRPGHIRFEPLGKEQALQRSQVEVESFKWNGTMSKKKGQKWGQERVSFSQKNDSLDSRKEQPEMANHEKEAHFHESIDFNKLPFLSGAPKEGLVIAYRLLELSSTWTPEVSSYRVGKVSWYNSEADRVCLIPVAEFPAVSIGDESSMQPDSSLYKEDGSLEIDFSSLLEVRFVKNGSTSDPEEVPGAVSEVPSTNESTPVLGTSNKNTDALAAGAGEENHGKQKQSTPRENGVNLWEQFSETLQAKKAELSGESRWAKGSSGKSSWVYRGLRGSALGPTMAFLRSKNGI